MAMAGIQARIVAAVVIFFLLLPTSSTGTEVICKEVRLKPLRCVCGTVVNTLGEPVARAKVTILNNGTTQATATTGEDGKFSFDSLKSGHYELHMEAAGYFTFQIPIVTDKAEKKCKQSLEISLTIEYACTGIRLVKR